MFIIFINKTEVDGTTTMAQYFSSRYLTKKSIFSHSYISMSSSEDAGVRHSGDFHWVPCDALALWPGAECICADCSGNYEGLHISQLLVLCNNDESVLQPSRALWCHYLGWGPSTFPSPKVLSWWWVWLQYPADIDCFCGVWSLKVILPDLLHRILSFGAISALSDSFVFRFFCFICWPSSTPSSRSSVHSHPCWTLRAWACPRGRRWRWCTQWFRERIPPAQWLTWMAHVKLVMRIALFVSSYRVIIFFMACIGGRDSYCISFLMYLVRFIL